ncbi:MAG: UDP-N-acetylglucosamine 1-carboxyvinyltransferase [Pantoea sp. Brub]|nr:UDP-N-acetylglucosamine 1-carboxyvinyltransferase [Pantoea sp. Brub]
MDKFLINGPTSLHGEIIISGAKNAALPILFATLLTEEPVEIQNIPNLRDINTTIKLLTYLGAKIECKNSTYIDTSKVNSCKVMYDLAKSMRASIWALGPLLARFGHGAILLPGGCAIGARPVDLHILGLKCLGAKITIDKGYLNASINGRLKGATIVMTKISVGATVTVMIAATLAIGITVIKNAAREPEIVDTANFLNMLGAKIIGAGNNEIIIKGVKRLRGGVYRILPDRIETGTFLVAAAVSGGSILCRNTLPQILSSVLLKLTHVGATIKTGKDWISLEMFGKRPKAIDIRTAPYPGFPTDMQSQFTILNLIANGTSVITETIFENRFMHIPELIRMGANLTIRNNKTICQGVKTLSGAKVMATDLRASASLVIAGCIAQGTTLIEHIDHIDRGYEHIENKLKTIGAKIKRISN